MNHLSKKDYVNVLMESILENSEEDAMISKIDAKRVFDVLSPQEAQAVLGIFVHGMSGKDVASDVGVSANYSHDLAKKALQKISTFLRSGNGGSPIAPKYGEKDVPSGPDLKNMMTKQKG